MVLLPSRWRVIGRENIPTDGQLIVVSNHLSLADPLLLVVSSNSLINMQLNRNQRWENSGIANTPG